MTDPRSNVHPAPVWPLPPSQLHAAALAVCDRTDDMRWPRRDTAEALRALGLLHDPHSKPGLARS